MKISCSDEFSSEFSSKLHSLIECEALCVHLSHTTADWLWQVRRVLFHSSLQWFEGTVCGTVVGLHTVGR